MESEKDEDDQIHSPVIGIVVLWANRNSASWEYDSHSSNSIQLRFVVAGLMYSAIATEEIPLCVTLRVSLLLHGTVDEIRLHRTLSSVNDEMMNVAVYYRYDRKEIMCRTVLPLDEEDLDDVDIGAKSVSLMVEEVVGVFDTVRKRLADLLHHTHVQVDLSMLPAQGRA